MESVFFVCLSSKEGTKKVLEEEGEPKMTSGTRARIRLRDGESANESGRKASPTDEAAEAETRRNPRPVDAVASATESAGGCEWSDEDCGDDRESKDSEEDEELDKDQERLDRAVPALE